jgi:crotonobetainyl-CoA:carnitine CoA-transferase CaiB-like acyl-CoA transferase
MGQEQRTGAAGQSAAPGFLDGIRVLSFCHYLQGPSGVQMLGDLGADVIKVEPPQGNYERKWSGSNLLLHGESVFFLAANRNKRSLCLDLKSPGGSGVIRDLLPTIDVFVENFRPGVMERLGFGYEAVRAVNPRVIYASCSGFGPDGPYRDRPGQDLLIQAMCGLAAGTGGKDAPPTPVGATVADQHGATLLAMSVLAALLRRERAGIGGRVDVNLLNAALDLQMEALTYFINGARKPPRSSTSLATWFHPAPYGVYPTADGHLAISLNPAARMAAALECPELQAYAKLDNYEHRDAISGLIRDALSKRPTDHWMRVLAAEKIWFAPVYDYPEVVEDPQVRHNGVFFDAEDHAGRPVRMVAHPVRYDGRLLPVRQPPPALGQHSLEILRQLDYSEERIQALLAEDAVRVAGPAEQ